VLKRLAKNNPDLARDLVGVTASLKRAKSATTATSGEPAAATAKATVQAATPAPAPEPATPSTTPPASPAVSH
jgi:hypothetical protein